MKDRKAIRTKTRQMLKLLNTPSGIPGRATIIDDIPKKSGESLISEPQLLHIPHD
jgi:hypothetical protein